ncbi:olfactomedin-like protein 3B, partial [Brachionichthys hirsutus]|uniref:olfactomedin-like protein 3B n=1 Tax=Brachionichthys hirsutus TaxID=412623 RepID=UPI00360545F4
MELVFVLLVSSAWRPAGAQFYQFQGLLDYVGDRLSAAEDRMQFWHQQSHRCHAELQDFSQQTSEAADGLGRQHGELLEDLEGAAARVDRLEQEMDRVEAQTPPRACANEADKVVEQDQVRGEEEEDEEWEELYSRVSDCVEIIAAIRSVKILKSVGGPKGLWT